MAKKTTKKASKRAASRFGVFCADDYECTFISTREAAIKEASENVRDGVEGGGQTRYYVAEIVAVVEAQEITPVVRDYQG